VKSKKKNQNPKLSTLNSQLSTTPTKPYHPKGKVAFLFMALFCFLAPCLMFGTPAHFLLLLLLSPSRLSSATAEDRSL
jgi:hypothetical protein